MVLELLDLPEDILITCLLHLPLDDVKSCLAAGNRILTTLIVTAPAIQFRFEQFAAGVVENANHPCSRQTTFDRRQALKEREARWLAVASASYQDSGRPNADTPAIDDTRIKQLIVHYTHLRGTDKEPRRCVVDSPDGKGIVDFCLATDMDLIVLITYSRTGPNQDMQLYEAHALSISQNGPHPASRNHTIEICREAVGAGLPHGQYKLRGSTLGISVAFFDHPHDRTLHLFDWITGERTLQKPESGIPGFIFLDDDLVLQFDSSRGGLQADSNGTRITLLLPALKATHEIIWETMDCGGQPGLASAADIVDELGYPAATHFRPDPAQSVFSLVFCTGPRQTNIESKTLVLVHRAKMVECLREAIRDRALGGGETVPAAIPWAEWGPRCTLWIELPRFVLLGANPRACVGTRFVANESESIAIHKPTRLTIYDVNPAAIVKARKMIGEGENEVELENVTIRVVEPDVDAAPGDERLRHSAFAERIVSSLGYVEIKSKEVFHFDSVHMNNESIVGENWSMEDGVRRLEVLWLG
ncbi:hypothetical protein HMN09_01098500 [Mycena chlorophos]|uniref:F-box domain-containing protein n=1 Tax=Mycena chlorophos TaxID=658473 RepID=A0A8H6W1V8_MYCCL|nr:hypothetical protein HMN09_01098500 [Mycena chlorophos]